MLLALLLGSCSLIITMLASILTVVANAQSITCGLSSGMSSSSSRRRTTTTTVNRAGQYSARSAAHEPCSSTFVWPAAFSLLQPAQHYMPETVAAP